jgi:RHS repeat-associated protein
VTSRAAIFYVYDGSRPRTSGGDGLSKGAQRATEGSSESEGRTATSGNVTALVDAADGSVVAHYDYSPFGMTVLADGPAAAANPWRFSTKYHDTETSLVYCGYRYYSSELGRWMNRDPIGDLVLAVPLATLVSYVSNEPIARVDWLGLVCICPPGSHYGLEQIVPPAANGCGPGMIGSVLIPDDPMLLLGAIAALLPTPIPIPLPIVSCPFSAGCDAHDICYGTCGSDRGNCDLLIYSDLLDICDSCWSNHFSSWNPVGYVWKAACYGVAGLYYGAVSGAGGGPFSNAQNMNCRPCCCP